MPKKIKRNGQEISDTKVFTQPNIDFLKDLVNVPDGEQQTNNNPITDELVNAFGGTTQLPQSTVNPKGKVKRRDASVNEHKPTDKELFETSNNSYYYIRNYIQYNRPLDEGFVRLFMKLNDPMKVAFVTEMLGDRTVEEVIEAISLYAMGNGIDVYDIIGHDRFASMFAQKFAEANK